MVLGWLCRPGDSGHGGGARRAGRRVELASWDQGSSRGLAGMGRQSRKWEPDYYGMCVGGGRVSVVVCACVGGEFLIIMGYQTGGG